MHSGWQVLRLRLFTLSQPEAISFYLRVVSGRGAGPEIPASAASVAGAATASGRLPVSRRPRVQRKIQGESHEGTLALALPVHLRARALLALHVATDSESDGASAKKDSRREP